MALNGAEGIGAMGIDTPLAVLSNQHQPLFNYFKQLFAQVTNPPIDSIREKVVTSTTIYLGESGNVLEEKEENCKMLRINNPILTNTDLLKIKNMDVEGFKVETIPITYYKNTSLEKAIDHLYVEADRAHREGANIIILSDRGVDENHVAIPSLLAVFCFTAVSGTDQKEDKPFCDPGEWRTARGTPFCNPFGLWCICHQSISGTGEHPGTDRSQHA